MSNLDDLTHHCFRLPNGGFVLCLDDGAVINAEARAMLQALNSRSTGGIEQHLEKLRKKGAEQFMGTYYVGYGHKSIGDCADVTVFIEGVSMLAAKAIQHWRLYSGQESSTRYIDFSKQPFINPILDRRGESIIEAFRDLYISLQPIVRKHLMEKFPIEDGESATVYDKAISARTFDITRGFLPAGAQTNLSCTMNLRQFSDALLSWRHHPLLEVRDIAKAIEKVLAKRYPSSFVYKRDVNVEAYEEFENENYYHHNELCQKFTCKFNGIDYERLVLEFGDSVTSRPRRAELPLAIAGTGVLSYEFLLDFGSFRDIHRHRAVIQRMPLLTTELGFHPWYLSQLPDFVKDETLKTILSLESKINDLRVSEYNKQYFTPMGYQISCELTGDLRALVYLVELRSTRFVHPTLVQQALSLANDLKQRIPYIALHLDPEPHRFDIRRGTQDIVEKQ